MWINSKRKNGKEGRQEQMNKLMNEQRKKNKVSFLSSIMVSSIDHNLVHPFLSLISYLCLKKACDCY
jgi:hypothetical protein